MARSARLAHGALGVGDGLHVAGFGGRFQRGGGGHEVDHLLGEVGRLFPDRGERDGIARQGIRGEPLTRCLAQFGQGRRIALHGLHVGLDFIFHDRALRAGNGPVRLQGVDPVLDIFRAARQNRRRSGKDGRQNERGSDSRRNEFTHQGFPPDLLVPKLVYTGHRRIFPNDTPRK